MDMTEEKRLASAEQIRRTEIQGKPLRCGRIELCPEPASGREETSDIKAMLIITGVYCNTLTEDKILVISYIEE